MLRPQKARPQHDTMAGQGARLAKRTVSSLPFADSGQTAIQKNEEKPALRNKGTTVRLPAAGRGYKPQFGEAPASAPSASPQAKKAAATTAPRPAL